MSIKQVLFYEVEFQNIPQIQFSLPLVPGSILIHQRSRLKLTEKKTSHDIGRNFPFLAKCIVMMYMKQYSYLCAEANSFNFV